jgi:peptide/nickel transport system substrate-binding protein
MKKFLSVTLTLVLVLALVTACSSPKTNTSTPVEPKKLTVAIPSDLSSLEPRNATQTITAGILNHVFSKLVTTDKDMKPVPDLAESWEQLNDLTWRFKLRKNATWQDGSKFIADDVVYTFSSIRDPKAKWALKTDFSFMSATKVDDNTVDITTDAPFPGLLLRLNYVMIIPKAYVEKVGPEEFAKAPIGTGPYKYVSRVKDQNIALQRYDNYFGGKSAIDTITYKIIPEAASRVAALEAGDVDFISSVPPGDFGRLSKVSSLNTLAYQTSRVSFIKFNILTDNPLKDIRVRQAINLAVDEKTIINGILEGHGVPVASLACPQYDGYDASIKPFEYNVEKAKALLAEAGYAKGMTLQGAYSNSTASSGDIMQYYTGELAKIGIKLELSQYTATALNDLIKAGTVAPLYFQAIGGPYANVDLLAKLCFSSKERYSTYTDPEFDALRQKAASTINKTERDKLNSQIQQYIVDKALAVPAYQNKALYAMNKRLTGWEARTDELLLFYKCDIKS